MNWYNLKKNKCPKCSKDFVKDLDVFENPVTIQRIFKHKCGFIISELRYSEIVTSQNNKTLNITEETI